MQCSGLLWFFLRKLCSPGYTWGLAFWSHVESTCMTGSFRPIKLVLLSFSLWLLYRLSIFDLRLLSTQFGIFRLSVTTSFFIEVPVPSQESERSCICVLEVMYLCVRGHVFICWWYLYCLFLRFVYLILELFRHCDILFSFYS